MSDEAERQAANAIPPTQSATPGLGVTILVATTTADSAAVPDALFGRYVWLVAEGDKIWVAFDSADAVDISKAGAGGATFALGTAAANAVPLASGTRLPVRLRKGVHDYVKWQADSTNSKLIIYPASPSRRVS